MKTASDRRMGKPSWANLDSGKPRQRQTWTSGKPRQPSKLRRHQTGTAFKTIKQGEGRLNPEPSNQVGTPATDLPMDGHHDSFSAE